MSFNALVYHEIKDKLDVNSVVAKPLKAANGYAINLPPALFLNSADFKAQMTYLVEANFHFLTMAEIRQFYEDGRDLPAKSILITFDDAFQSLKAVAYPILKERGIKATLFVVSGWAFDQAPAAYDPSRSQVLSWQEIDELSDVFEFANHTHELHQLVEPGVNGVMTASLAELKADLDRCQAYVQHQDTFAYPFGFYNEQLVSHLETLGFRYAFTTKVGVNNRQTPTLLLNRSLVYTQMPFEQFKKIVHA